jgi:hypothetical protein
MAPVTEPDFDQVLLQLSALRNDVVEASAPNFSLERRAASREVAAKRLDPAGDAGMLDPSLWVG